MRPKKTSLMYKILYFFINLFFPRMKIVGMDNLPEGPCILVGNHSQMTGPLLSELRLELPHETWCAGQMMTWSEVADYAFTDFWSFKPRWTHPFFRLLSWLVTPIAICLFNNAHTIAVYHDTRLISTFRDSIEKLKEGNSMVIFPECYDEHNNIVHEFQDKFIDLARFYYKKTGVELSFVPMYLAPKLKTVYYGKPIRFCADADIKDERKRICGELMDAITEIAVSLPEHTVIPYPNISARHYGKNIPLEVYGK